VRAEKTTAIPVSMFIVPLDDVFHSVVTRDSVPDPGWRAFTFHFKPGATRAGRLRRLTEVLGVTEADLEEVGERRTALPSPVLGHEQVVGEIDRLLEGQRLSVTGNYFAGLSIEDCVSRSREEWARVEKLQGVGDPDPGGS